MVSKVKEKNWFSKHPVIRMVVLIFGVLLIIGGISNIIESNKDSTGFDDYPKDNTLSVASQENFQAKCIPVWNCTSWAECAKSGTQTRTCSDSNNCGTTLGKPTTSRPCTVDKEWQNLTKYEGKGNQNTESFYVSSDRVRITAETCCGFANEYGVIGTYSSISLRSEDGEYLGTGLLISTDGIEKGYGQTIYRDIKEGQYYISVITGVNWEVNVEEGE